MTPKIYVFSAVEDGQEGACYALAEDGTILGDHWCSREGWAYYDLGVLPGYAPDRHVRYHTHYPDGYEMEFIPAKDLATHAGFLVAATRNRENQLRDHPEESETPC